MTGKQAFDHNNTVSLEGFDHFVANSHHISFPMFQITVFQSCVQISSLNSFRAGLIPKADQTGFFKMTFRAVMFDMDGTLLDTERLYGAAFDDACNDFDLGHHPDVFLRCVGVRFDKTREIIEGFLDGPLGFEAFCEAWDTHAQRHNNLGIPLKTGVIELLDHLAGLGMPMGIATSTPSKTAHAKLKKTGLAKYFAHVVCGDDVRDPKPNPEPYLTLAGLLGVATEHCVAFEDSEAGARSAFAAGAMTVQVPDLVAPPKELQGLGHTIADTILDGAASVGLIENAKL